MSPKIKSSLEVLTGIIFIFGYLWFISPLHSPWTHVLSAILILSFFIYCETRISNTKRIEICKSNNPAISGGYNTPPLGAESGSSACPEGHTRNSDFIDKKSFHDIGFSMDNWYGSFKIQLIFTSITIPILYVIWQFFFPVKSFSYNGYVFWTQFVTKLFEALCQQYIFLAFFFRRYRDIFSPHTHIAIIFSALTFSMIHIPTPPLIIFCFVAGVVWAGAYNKYPNLFTIAISHAILGIFCSSVLLVYTNVGPNADIGRWCKEESVYGGIDSVNNIDPDNNINSKSRVVEVNLNQGKNSIFIKGWVASKDKIKNIRISLGGKDFSVHYGDKREDVAAYFNNPNYLYSGFTADIPVSNFARGYYKLVLKVYLEGEYFSIHYPYPNIWVNFR